MSDSGYCTCYWSREGGSCEDADSISPIDRIPDIGESASNDGQRRRRSKATEESTKHDGFDILRDSDGYLKDGKA
jgi:hypothetical protein